MFFCFVLFLKNFSFVVGRSRVLEILQLVKKKKQEEENIFDEDQERNRVHVLYKRRL